MTSSPVHAGEHILDLNGLKLTIYRPSSAIISAIQNDKRAIENIILDLKNSAPEGVADILRRVTIVGGSVQLQTSTVDVTVGANQDEQRRTSRAKQAVPSQVRNKLPHS